MISTTTFVFSFLAAGFVSIVIVFLLNKKADPLQKAWNVYGAMYVMHGILFAGLLLTLPATSSSYSTGSEATLSVKTLEEVSAVLQRQRDEIERVKTQIHETANTILMSAYILALFAPGLYYNLFKYNLEIERLSGKRMGSFD